MTRAAAALHALTRSLRGELSKPVDWTAVIELANRSWLTPTLYCSLASAGRLGELPDEIRGYLSFIHARNRERNMRMREQLFEAIAALNGIGIRPVLLKGAIGLFTSPDARIGSRLMSDIDMGIGPSEFAAAKSRLFGLGYKPVDGDRALGRPSDAALLEPRPHEFQFTDLPGRPQSGRSQYLSPSLVTSRTACAYVPSPTDQASHLIRHDMLKEGDYWRGRIDLRHLHDLALLAGTDEGIDCDHLRHVMPRNPERNALETQLLTLHALFGIAIPGLDRRLSMVRLQFWRRMLVATHPAAGPPLRLAGNLFWGWKRMLSVDDPLGQGISDFLLRSRRLLTESSSGPKV